MKNIFAVQLIIEDTTAGGWNSEESFLDEMKNTFFEDFPEYKMLSVDTCSVCSGEAVSKLCVSQSSNQFEFQEAN